MVDLLWPREPIALAVLALLGISFSLWAYWLLRSWHSLRRERATLKKLSNREQLEWLAQTGDDPEVGQNQLLKRLHSRIGISRKSIIVKHVWAIYTSGSSESRLEVNELLKYSVGELFQSNRSLKSVLGVFIVIGLLGTLIGLSAALAEFSTAPTDGVAEVLQRVLLELKTALAPSIWGVGLTIAGVGAFSLYESQVCAPLKSMLEWLTLRVWVPELYPTSAQKTEKRLERAEEQLEDNLRLASDVAELAHNIDDELSDFDKRLIKAGEVLNGFTEAMDKAEGASARLESALVQIGSSQETVKELTETSIERSEEIQNLMSTLSSQNERISSQLERLEQNEAERTEKDEELRSQLKGVANATESALESLRDRNESIIDALAEPLNRQLKEIGKELSNVDETMYGRLTELKKSLDRVETPVSASADKIENIATTFAKAVERSMREVKGEFKRQNEELSGRHEELQKLNDNLGLIADNQKELVRSVRTSTGMRTSIWKKTSRTIRGWFDGSNGRS